MSREQMYKLIRVNKERPSDGLVNDIHKLAKELVDTGELSQDDALDIIQSL
ncbi:hypothetical protein ABI214_24115 [Prescottella soli]|uniref:Uncharacterized protein n=1 Tax=Prescottella soli TaxID=1543852 RepID=A0ABW9FVB8_9NOCA